VKAFSGPAEKFAERTTSRGDANLREASLSILVLGYRIYQDTATCAGVKDARVIL
jgi:hypothetical protein